jgi:DNA-binding transcriptional LysR family regulator
MELNQLQYFQTVAQLQHFTHAAEALSISQPALSRSIARLEEELGIPLFERQGRSVSLNPYGQLFLKRVNRVLQEIDFAQNELQNLIDPGKGSVSLGFIHSQGSNLVPDLLGSFRKTFPMIRFKLYQNITNQLLDKLENGEIDLCFCSQPSREHIQWLKLFSEEIVLIVPKDHPLATRQSITLQELADEPFIVFKEELSLGEIIFQLFQQAGFSPKITFEGEEFGTVAGLVSAALGIALIPRSKAQESADVSIIHISEPKCERVVGISWVEGHYLSPAAKNFKEFVLEHFNSVKSSI